MTQSNWTAEHIDERVYAGKCVSHFIGAKAPKIPPRVKDWNLHVIHTGTSGGQIVAVPTSGRTRCIYNRGRAVWLQNLGYTEEQAQTYMLVSVPYKYRWEEPVAQFVLKNMEMDQDTWYDITRAKQPSVRARELGLVFEMSESRLKCAMQLLMNMWEHEPE